MRLVPIPLSTVRVLHEVLFPLHREVFGAQPHLDPEIKSPEPKKEIAAVNCGARSNEELPSHVRQRTLYEKSLCVTTYKNKRAKIDMLSAFVDAARELADAYPHMKRWERQMCISRS